MRNLVVATLAGLSTAVAAALVLAVSMAYFGWVLSILWGWFVPPVFGLREISIPEVIGLVLIVSLLRMRNYGKDLKGEPLVKLAAAVLAPLIALLFGYVTLQFI